jgi:hypothetical protein
MKRSLPAAAAMLLLATTIAAAQEVPDEATKIWALKRAYELNGNSMVGCIEGVRCQMIDLSKPIIDPPKTADAVPPKPDSKKPKK